VSGFDSHGSHGHFAFAYDADQLPMLLPELDVERKRVVKRLMQAYSSLCQFGEQQVGSSKLIHCREL